MLRSLNGDVLSIGDDNYIILDVNGMGFEILCSRAAVTLCRENLNNNSKTRLVTYLQISEAGAALYGFASERERKVFLKITSIKGVGGRSGMAVLSTLSVDEILRAVSNSDTAAFERVPGIGKKTAERLCFELRGILSDSVINNSDNLNDNQADLNNNKIADTVNIVTDALLSLGFSHADASAVFALIRAAQGDDFNNMNEETLLKLALRELNKNKKK